MHTSYPISLPFSAFWHSHLSMKQRGTACSQGRELEMEIKGMQDPAPGRKGTVHKRPSSENGGLSLFPTFLSFPFYIVYWPVSFLYIISLCIASASIYQKAKSTTEAISFFRGYIILLLEIPEMIRPRGVCLFFHALFLPHGPSRASLLRFWSRSWKFLHARYYTAEDSIDILRLDI